MNRRGFALISVLWLVTLVASVVGLSVGAARLGQRATFNRIVLTRGRWAAEACLAIAQRRWREGRLSDTATVDLGRGVRCGWRVDDPATRINVNTAGADVLSRLLDDPAVARGLIDARDRAPFVSDAQLPPSLRHLLTAQGLGVVNVSRAPARVLAALPGMTPEAVDRILAGRSAARPIATLDELSGLLSPGARDALLTHYADLARLVVTSPSRLILTAQGWQDGAAPRATIEVVVVPVPERLAVVRRRMW